jgi:SAM-dependent methyltransferase
MEEHTVENTLHATAPFYDLDLRILAEENLRPGRIDDVPFYLARAAHCAGPILEMACGTGRVTIPLAEAAQEVWAFDLSADMLREFHAKLARLPVEVQQRIHLMQADMCAFDLARHFALIVAPGVSFQALITPTQQRACLACVRAHLALGGQFILHLRHAPPVQASWVRPETLSWEKRDPQTGHLVRCTDAVPRVDVAQQLFYYERIFSVQRPDGTEKRLMESHVFRAFTVEEVRQLLAAAGFTIREELGNFDGRAIGTGPELLFVCV